MAGALLAGSLACSCSRSADSQGDNPKLGASGTPSAVPSPSARAAPPKPWYEGRWSGTYTAELERVELPAGGIRAWKDDDGKAASGAGTLDVSVSRDGVASGDAKGPLGEQTLAGYADDRGLFLALTPRSEEAGAFRGTLVAERSGDRLQGSLRASSGDSATVRKAKVALGPSAPP